MINKYKIEMSKELLLDYYDSLINDCFKLLPLYEGIDFSTKRVIYSPVEAHKQYKKYLSSFITEVFGSYYMFENIYLLKLTNNLEGMLNIEISEHDKIKQLVFKCISIINKLKEEIKDGT